MEGAKIREPKQKRSIEKKQKIIDAGYKLFCEKGYQRTTTAEIAKAAGVSTGIVYSYFMDKKDILIESIEMIYSLASETLFYNTMRELKTIDEVLNNLGMLIDRAADFHVTNKDVHSEYIALSYVDEDISAAFKKCMTRMIYDLSDVIRSLGYDTPGLCEKISITVGIIENYAHEYAYHKYDGLDYDLIKGETILLIKSLFEHRIS